MRRTRLKSFLMMTGAALATAAVAPNASAQSAGESLALNRFTPAPAGDNFFGVQSPFVAGDKKLHVMLMADFAHKPLTLRQDSNDAELADLVSNQLFAHLNASYALFNRVNFNVSIPVAILQSGDNFQTAEAPSSAQLGDVRLGARGRILGEYNDIFQLGVGAYVWVPTGSNDSFVSDGSVRALPEAIIGGRHEKFVWTFAAGPELRSSSTINNVKQGSTIRFGGGVAALLGKKKRIQVGPEAYGSTVLSDSNKRNTNAEVLLGGKYRFKPDWVAGLAAGPGLTSGIGTPAFRVLASVAYTPQVVTTTDTDGDGIEDKVDACPTVKGVANSDPAKNGCPPDSDGDGILDKDDACPTVKGIASSDPKKHGCPPPGDKDGDGINDEEDACVDIPGVPTDDPKTNGCPGDRDGDGVRDDQDACVEVPGVKTDDPKTNGCPGDTDGDGIRDDKDACPREKGKADADPKKNGCPTSVRVTDKEIIILQQVQFDTGRATIKAVSNALLDEVAGVLKEHPEITKIEIQGHTDSRGSKWMNNRLSKNRAKAVMAAMVKRGIAKERMTSKGYGPDKPIADNKTKEGRAKNRRVQFVVVERKKPEAKPAK